MFKSIRYSYLMNTTLLTSVWSPSGAYVHLTSVASCLTGKIIATYL